MEDKKLTEKESLELIAKLIQNTREKVKKNAGTPFLIWGYTTIFVALVTWYMVLTTANYHWHFLWFLIPVLGSPLNFMFFSKHRKEVTTFVDRMVGKIWLVFGVAAILVSAMAFIVDIPILFLIMLLISMAVMLTGFVIRFNIAVTFGIFGILASFAFLFIHGTNQILLFSGVFLVMMVIPGHILNYLTRKELCSKN